jgi:hypothetical protein
MVWEVAAESAAGAAAVSATAVGLTACRRWCGLSSFPSGGAALAISFSILGSVRSVLMKFTKYYAVVK